MGQSEDDRLVVRLFGRFEVSHRGIPIPTTAWGRRKTRQLFKLLLTEPGRTFTIDQLIENLYDQQQPDKVIKNLRGRVSELRHALEPDLQQGQDSQFILNTDGGYLFNSDSDSWVDTLVFGETIDEADAKREKDHWEAALNLYEEAITLYAGEFLAEDLYEDWTETARNHWQQLYLTALSRAAECEAQLGNYDSAIRYLRSVLRIEHHRESAYRHIMVYHSWASERDMAIRVYEECVEILREYLDVEPSTETQVIYGHILSDKLPKPAPFVPNNLPESTTSFVGREEELIELGEKLQDPKCRLLSLVGPGGIGKTRLALQAAQEHLAQFRDGVFFIPLAPVQRGDLLSESAGEALGFQLQEGANATEQLIEHLKHKFILIILDNLEHLQLESEDWMFKILEGTSHLKILATSRERIHLGSDHPSLLTGLSYPTEKEFVNDQLAQYEAVKLFLQIAKKVAPGYAFKEDDHIHVVQLCRLLDGLPLGIELAASWTSSHSCQEILAQIESYSENPVADQIESESNDLETQQRHRSLRAAFEWSWQLLPTAEQAVLARLSVFRSDFDKKAAHMVAEAMPVSISSYIDKSLLQRVSAERFSIHEAIREFLLEKLSAIDEYKRTARRHGNYFLSFITDRAKNLESSETRAVNEVAQELKEIRAAWSWAIREDHAVLELAIGPLSQIYEIRSRFHAGSEALREAVDFFGDKEIPAYHRLLVRYGRLLMRLRCHQETTESLEKGLRLAKTAGDPLEVAHAERALGLLAQEQGDYGLAEERLQTALELYEKLQNDRGIANVFHGLALVAYWRGSFKEGYQYASQSLDRFEALSDQRSSAMALDILGLLANKQGHDSEAEGYFRQCLVIHRKLGDRRRLSTGLSHLGIALYH